MFVCAISNENILRTKKWVRISNGTEVIEVLLHKCYMSLLLYEHYCWNQNRNRISKTILKGLNQTESPIFVILCILCFQRQFFLSAHDKTYNKTYDQGRFRWACTQADQASQIACAFSSLQAIQRGINKNHCTTGRMYKLIFCRLHRSYCWFCHVLAQINSKLQRNKVEGSMAIWRQVSAEHEICPGNKSHLLLSFSNFLVENISCSVHSWTEHEKSFITLGPAQTKKKTKKNKKHIDQRTIDPTTESNSAGANFLK